MLNVQYVKKYDLFLGAIWAKSRSKLSIWLNAQYFKTKLSLIGLENVGEIWVRVWKIGYVNNRQY